MTAPSIPIPDELNAYRVIPYGYGPGWQVVHGNTALHWFPSFDRAQNEARDRNEAALLRAKRRMQCHLQEQTEGGRR